MLFTHEHSLFQEEKFSNIWEKYQQAINSVPSLNYISIEINNDPYNQQVELNYMISKFHEDDLYLDLTDLENSPEMAAKLIFVSQTHHAVVSTACAIATNYNPDIHRGSLIVSKDFICFAHDYDFLSENTDRLERIADLDFPMFSMFSDTKHSSTEQILHQKKFLDKYPVLDSWLIKNAT